jgi:uncharacterized protein DUF6755
MTRQEQGTILFTALLVLIGIGVVVQLWLLAASVDAVLRHNSQIPLDAAIGSLVVFLINSGLLMYVFWFDRKIRH